MHRECGRIPVLHFCFVSLWPVPLHENPIEITRPRHKKKWQRGNACGFEHPPGSPPGLSLRTVMRTCSRRWISCAILESSMGSFAYLVA